MPIPVKTFSDLDSDTVGRLTNLGYSDALNSGTTIRSAVESVDLHLSQLYSDLEAGMSNTYLSSAMGAHLDALGLLVGVVRRSGEVDENLRFRISRALTSSKTANLVALTEALFSLNNVRDVIVRPYAQGIGTVSFYIIAVNGIADSTTLALAQSTVDSIAAGGAASFVLTPVPVFLDLTGTLSIASGATLSTAKSAAVVAITSYIANLSMGDPFIKLKLDQVILDASPSIVDFNLLTLSATQGGVSTQLLLANYQPQFDEELEPGTITLN